MRALVEACVAEARSGSAARCDIGELPDCDADPALLRQVLLNLIGNAFKYSARVPAPRIEIGCERKAGEDVYYVRDNGVGFDMKYADRLFGVFQRLHDGEFEGTGVGLAIVQRIVHRHDGRVWVYAEPGRGATFYFTIRSSPPRP
jgi:light-regulated signal transduction histidine kinase (bacteriophytochrome)